MTRLGTLGTLAVDIRVNMAPAEAAINRFRARFASLGRLSLGSGVGGAGIVGFFAKQAADAEESTNKFKEIFKEQTALARAWSEDFAKAVNRSAYAIRDHMAKFQSQFIALGFNRARSREMTQTVTKLGVDLASFHNFDETKSMNNLYSGLMGNHRALRMFGVAINQSILDQELMRMGFSKVAQGAREEEKALARLNIMLRQTADANDDAARTSQSPANAFKGFIDRVRVLGIEMGQSLMPTMRSVLKVFEQVVQSLRSITPENKMVIGQMILMAGAGTALVPVIWSIVAAVSALGGPLTLMAGLLGLCATAYALARVNGESYGDTLLRLTNLGDMRGQLVMLDQDGARQAAAKDLLEGAHKATNTEAAPDTLADTAKRLREEAKQLERDADYSMTHMNAGGFWNFVTGDAVRAGAVADVKGKLQEAQRRKLLAAELERQIPEQTRIAAEKKAERESMEAKEKADAIAERQILRYTKGKGGKGFTSEQLGMLSGAGDLVSGDKQRLARVLWESLQAKKAEDALAKSRREQSKEAAAARREEERRRRELSQRVAFRQQLSGAGVDPDAMKSLVFSALGGVGLGGALTAGSGMISLLALGAKLKDDTSLKFERFTSPDQIAASIQESILAADKKRNEDAREKKRMADAARDLITSLNGNQQGIPVAVVKQPNQAVAPSKFS